MEGMFLVGLKMAVLHPLSEPKRLQEEFSTPKYNKNPSKVK